MNVKQTMLAIAGLLFGFAPAAAQAPASPGPVALVTRMYQAYAADAVIDSPEYRPTDLFGRSKAIMSRYLDDELVALVVADAECAKRTREICNLDFMPMWDSQDPIGSAVKITATKDPARVQADVNFLSKTGVRHLTYVLVKTAAGWRIHDIEYASHESLLQILRAK